MFDILFRNAKVIDGTGNPWFYGDVGVEGGTVAAVLPPGSTARARRVEDVDGKALCPGFVDGHSPVSYTHLDVYKRQDGKPGQGGFRRMVPGAGDTCAATRTRNPSGLCRMRISGHGRPHRILLRKLLQRSCRGLVKTSCGDPSSMITPSASTSTRCV